MIKLTKTFYYRAIVLVLGLLGAYGFYSLEALSQKHGVQQGIDFLYNSCYATEQSFIVDPDDGRIISCGRVGQLSKEELEMFKKQGSLEPKEKVLDKIRTIVYNIS